MFCRNSERDAPPVAELDEVRALERGLGEQHAVVGDDPDGVAADARETADERRAVQRLELVELGSVDQPRNDFAHVVRMPRIARDDSIEFLGGERGRHRLAGRCRRTGAVEVADESPRHPQRVRVIVGEMIDDARLSRMHVAAAQGLGIDALTGRGLHERRATEKDRALLADDDRLVAHRGYVRAASRARAHDDGELRNAARGQLRLVVEDPSEMLAIGEHLVLTRQEGAARIDEIDARQRVLERDLLRAQMLLDGDRVVRPALHRRVVRDDDAFETPDAADARDDATGGNPVAIEFVPGECPDLEKWRARIEQPVDALSSQHLAAFVMLRAGLRRTARADAREQLAQLVGELPVDALVGSELRRIAVDLRGERAHRVSRWPRTTRARSACAGSRSCPPRSRRAWRRAAGAPWHSR